MISLASAAVVFADTPRKAAKVRCSDGTQVPAGKHACKRNGGTLRPGPIATDKLKPIPQRDPIASRPRVVCADGTVAKRTGRGACTGHGGIAPTTTHTTHSGEPVALCRDGWVTTPSDHPATCTLHGGVREWLGG